METKIAVGVGVLVLAHTRWNDCEVPKYSGTVEEVTEDGQFACVVGGWRQWFSSWSFREWVSVKSLRVIKKHGPVYPADNGWHYSLGE